MRRSTRDVFIDAVIAGIATFGWCVVAPMTVLGCELADLFDALGAHWRELLVPFGDAA